MSNVVFRAIHKFSKGAMHVQNTEGLDKCYRQVGH